MPSLPSLIRPRTLIRLLKVMVNATLCRRNGRITNDNVVVSAMTPVLEGCPAVFPASCVTGGLTRSLHCLSGSRHCSLARLAMVHLFTIKVARARSAVAHLHAYLEPSSCRRTLSLLSRALSLLSRAIGGHEPSDVLEAIFRAESTRHLDGLATGVQKQGIRIAPQCGGQTADLALAAV
jgi:hypothetical protein